MIPSSLFNSKFKVAARVAACASYIIHCTCAIVCTKYLEAYYSCLIFVLAQWCCYFEACLSRHLHQEHPSSVPCSPRSQCACRNHGHRGGLGSDLWDWPSTSRPPRDHFQGLGQRQVQEHIRIHGPRRHHRAHALRWTKGTGLLHGRQRWTNGPSPGRIISADWNCLMGNR